MQKIKNTNALHKSSYPDFGQAPKCVGVIYVYIQCRINKHIVIRTVKLSLELVTEGTKQNYNDK